MALLEVKDMRFRYYGSSFEICGVNLTLEKGQRLVVYGREGSGKTTLLRLLCSLEKYSQGSILLEGKDINNLSQKDMEVGFTFDRSILKGKTNVGEVISLPMMLRGVLENNIKAYLQSVAERLRLPMTAQVKDLSDTQVATLILARLFAVERRLYLVDDVWKDLDGEGKRLAVEFLLENISSKSVIVATSDEDLAKSLADERILVVTDREVAPALGLKQIIARPINMQSAILAGYELHIGELVRSEDGYFAHIGEGRYRVSEPMSEIYVGKRVCFAVKGQGRIDDSDRVGEGEVKDFYYDAEVEKIISIQY